MPDPTRQELDQQIERLEELIRSLQVSSSRSNPELVSSQFKERSGDTLLRARRKLRQLLAQRARLSNTGSNTPPRSAQAASEDNGEQEPPRRSLISEAIQGDTIQLPLDTLRTTLSDQSVLTNVFRDELERRRRIDERGPFSGFLSDAFTMARETFEDLGQSATPGAPPMLTDLIKEKASQLLTPDAERKRRSLQTMERNALTKLQESNPEPLDMVANVTASGFVRGLTFGLNEVPLVGDYIEAVVGPLQERLDTEAMDLVQRNAQALDSEFGQLMFTSVPTVVSGLTGTLTGAWFGFKPWMFAGNVLLNSRRLLQARNLKDAAKLAQGGFVGDLAGIMLFGGLTGERGIISGLTEGSPEERFGERLFEMEVNPTDPWWKQTLAQGVNRAEAAAAIGAEGAFFGAGLVAGASLFKMAESSRLAVAARRMSLLGDTNVTGSDLYAKRLARIFSDPSARRFARIRGGDEAKIMAEIETAENLIGRSQGAQRLLEEQGTVEGIVSHQTYLAALAKAVDEVVLRNKATHGVLRGVDDPWRMIQDITRGGEVLPRPGLKLPQRMERPLAHSTTDVPREGFFGYTDDTLRAPLSQIIQDVDPNVPIFLSNRPSLPAADRGVLEEIVVLPKKVREFASWNELLLDFGSLDDAIRTLRGRGVSLIRVNNTGPRGGRQDIILDPSVIVSSRSVTPNLVESVSRGPVESADDLIKEMANEPMEISLQKRMPGYQFETPVKRPDGTYDIVFSKKGAPSLSRKPQNPKNKEYRNLLQQFKETGFFEGQRVVYSNKVYEVVRRRGGEGRGATIELRDPTTGDEGIVASVRNVTDLPEAQIPTDVDEALYRDFVDYFDKQLGKVHELQPGEATLRDIAVASGVPTRMNRDFADGGTPIVVYPEEVLGEAQIADDLVQKIQQIDEELQALSGQAELVDFSNVARIRELVQERVQLQKTLQDAARQAQVEGALTHEVNIDDAFVNLPDPLDYETLIFSKWLQDRNIEMSVGEAESLKHTFFRRMVPELFDRLPAAERQRFRALRDEIQEAMEGLPDTVEALARVQGYELFRLKGGEYVVSRPGSLYFEGLYDSEEAVYAALNHSLRQGAAPNLMPQINWLNASLPGGSAIGMWPGAKIMDMHVFEAEGLQPYLSRLKEWKSEMFPLPKSKPRWALEMEEATGVPFWTEYIEPLFASKAHTSNAKLPFLEDYVNAFSGLGPRKRVEIDEFIRTIESESTFRNIDEVVGLANEFGLDERQIEAIKQVRSVMDNLFPLVNKWFGLKPFDFIYNFATRMRPWHETVMRGQAVRNENRFYAGILPKEYDVFMSKLKRSGQMPIPENDPLIYGFKYINTLFDERFVAPHWERLNKLINVRFRDLPANVANKIKENMPSAIREAHDPGDYALPNSIRGPLNEMLTYIRGYPKEAESLTNEAIRRTLEALGVKMDARVVGELVNSAMMLHYGSTLGFRPATANRNTFQPFVNFYQRVGATALKKGWERAFDEGAFLRAVDEGIIDLGGPRGVAFGDVLTRRLIDQFPIETEGATGWFTGGILRSLLLDGLPSQAWRDLTEKGLLGIQRTDQLTRVIAAEAQDAFTRPWLTKLLNNKIDEATFQSRGLRFWEKPIRDKFMDLLDKQGSKEAMTYIRREASRLVNYDYTKAAQPTLAQTTGGRAAFQYMTWPVWRKDLFMRDLRGAESALDYFTLGARQAMIGAAFTVAGIRMGADVGSWMAHNALFTAGGGPMVSIAFDLGDVMQQRSWPQRWAAIKRLARDNFLRVFPPGRLFAEDAVFAIENLDYPQRAFAKMMIGRPNREIRSWHNEIASGLLNSEDISGGGTITLPELEDVAPGIGEVAPELPDIPPILRPGSLNR